MENITSQEGISAENWDGSIATAVSSASAVSEFCHDVEKEYTTIRQLRPELLNEISENLNNYVYRNAVEIVNFKTGVIDNEFLRRSQESPFTSYKGRYYMLRLEKDVCEKPQTYIFKVEDTFLAEDEKTYWRYQNGYRYQTNCTSLFDFMAYALVSGYVFSKTEAPSWFGTKKADNYELRKNNLFGIDRDGRIFCTECTYVQDTQYSGNGNHSFEATYAIEITENQYQYIESVVK